LLQFRFSRRAEADLGRIADFIARENPERAVSFLGALRLHCRKLVAFPKSAPLRPELGDGVRLKVFRNYLILYVLHTDVLEIRRVVHGAQDLASRTAAALTPCRGRL
jgi:toxin ParE1/3/4